MSGPYYFAYGANVCVDMMRQRGIAFTGRVHAALPRYSLSFNKRAYKHRLPPHVGYAHVQPDAEASVEGVLYQVTAAALVQLDAHERAPQHYRRETVEVLTGDGPRDCFIYRAHPDRLGEGLIPPRNYLNRILAGRDLFSVPYVSVLESWQTFDEQCLGCQAIARCELARVGQLEFAFCQVCLQSKVALERILGRATLLGDLGC